MLLLHFPGKRHADDDHHRQDAYWAEFNEIEDRQAHQYGLGLSEQEYPDPEYHEQVRALAAATVRCDQRVERVAEHCRDPGNGDEGRRAIVTYPARDRLAPGQVQRINPVQLFVLQAIGLCQVDHKHKGKQYSQCRQQNRGLIPVRSAMNQMNNG